MSGRHIHHLTLTTGHTRRSWRHEIDPGVLRDLGRLLRRGIDTGRIDLTMIEPAGHWVRVTPHGKCVLLTVMHGDDMPLVTFGVAAHSRCGARMWRLLTQDAVVAEGAPRLSPDRAPQEPWCAARIEPGLMYRPDAAQWLGDFERCIAWAWLDHLETRRDDTGPDI